MKVKKRNGGYESFEARKVTMALLSAFSAAGKTVPDVSPLLRDVVKRLVSVEGDTVSVDLIQDTLQTTLMASGHHEAAQSFIIYRHERKKLRERRLKPDPVAMSSYIHVGKYAQYDPTTKRREIYPETVRRVKNMHLKKFPQLEDKLAWAFQKVEDKFCLPSMRSMQFGGKAIEVHNARGYNCSFTLVDRAEVFSEIFYLLLCGAGVGFSVQWKHVDQLPQLAYLDRKNVYHHTIEDTIEGWADAVNMLIDSFISGYWVEFSYHKIRAEGAQLKTSGGKAPGHLALKAALESIRSLLLKAQGRKLRPIEAHDIICFEAEAVLAGGIRRSSLLSLFSANDTEMLYCKDKGVFNPQTGLNKQREMANNSVVLLRDSNDRTVFDRVIKIAQANFGDPGFYFTNDEDYGPNPCGEIGLHPVYTFPSGKKKTGFAFCNLCEVNAARCKDEEQFLDACCAAAIIGTVQAAYTSFPYLGEVTELIAKRDALLGVGIVGMMNNPILSLNPEVQRKGANVVLNTNALIADLIGINHCARGTTIKPGGTSAKELDGIESGIHPAWARRYFQRVTANSNEPYAIYFKSINPHMVEIKPNGDWSIIFPIEVSEDAKTVKNMPASEMLDNVFVTYENWVRGGTNSRSEAISPGLTHNVSCTVTVRDNEISSVLETVWENRHRVAAMSFVPYLLDKLFPFAPKEEVSSASDEAKWNNLIQNYKPVDWALFNEVADTTNRQQEAACVSGACEI